MTDHRIYKEMASGSIGMATASVLLNPLDVGKVRIQQQVFRTTNLLECWKLSAVESGGVFRGLVLPGLSATCLRDILNGAFRVGLYKEMELWIFGNQSQTPILVRKIATGTIVGCLGAGVWSHTDLIKTRMQCQVSSHRHLYRNTWDCYKKVFQKDGLPGLFRGAGPNMLRASVITTSHVGTYDASKKYFTEELAVTEGVLLWMGCGITSGLVTTTLAAPVDLIRTRKMMMSGGVDSGSSSFSIAKNIFVSEGVLGLFRGWVPSFLRFGPHFSISWPLIELARTRIFHLEPF